MYLEEYNALYVRFPISMKELHTHILGQCDSPQVEEAKQAQILELIWYL